MNQGRIYEAAKELLAGIADYHDCQLTIGEKLFLYRNCLQQADGSFNVVEGFSAADLKMLIRIINALRLRQCAAVIH